MRVGSIVEGHGECEAVPVLLRRILELIDPVLVAQVARPHRVSRGKLVQEGELKRAVELVARRGGPADPILVLLDADDDPACRLGPRLLAWAREVRPDRKVSVVLAVREFEAWFLAGASSLAGRRTLPTDLQDVIGAEELRSPKGWLGQRMENGYAETLDQPALAQVLDVARARSADSFDKLVRDLAALVDRPCPAR